MTITTDSFQHFLQSLLQGDRLQCHEIINDYWCNKAPVLNIYEELIKKAMYEVGDLWEKNQISVASEHLSSAIIESILIDLQLKSKHASNKENIVLAGCIENEYHQIGIKIIGDIFEKNGWKSYFLGANTPTNELLKFAELVQPKVFALSLSIYSHLLYLEKMIHEIRAVFPEELIIVGGQAFRHGGAEVIKNHYNVILLTDSFQTEKFIQSLSS